MNRQPVQSSNIRSIGYDAEKKMLQVEFASGIYNYSDVPAEAYAAIKRAKSVGGYFAAQIRGKFASEKVQAEGEAP